MSPRTADSCPHELRPGLTICLHCRRAEREAKSARTRRILARTSFAIGGLALCLAIGYFGASALQGRSARDLLASAADLVSRAQAAVPRLVREKSPAPAPRVDSPAATTVANAGAPTHATAHAAAPTPDLPAGAIDSTVVTTALDLPLTTAALPGSGSVATPAAAAGRSSSGVPAPSVQPTALASTPAEAPVPPSPLIVPAVPRYTPIIPQGRTELGGDGLYAVRDGAVVRVHFDTELGRTRRPPKFEQIVRATLPAVLGPAVDSLLRQVPVGRIASSGDLLTELPTRGVELRHVDGRHITVWPETRAGRDGPIVVSYRVTTAR